MIRFLLKAIFVMVALSPVFFNQIEAYCSRCVKIEEAREREQKNKPQSIGYYDDQMKLDEEDKALQIKSAPNRTEDSTKTGVGDNKKISSPQPKLTPPSNPTS